jgi:hypothetical protein
MQLTAILAVLFSCLVLFASVEYTNGTIVKGKSLMNRPDPFVKSGMKVAARPEGSFKHGRRQFAGRAIVESLKSRRQR